MMVKMIFVTTELMNFKMSNKRMTHTAIAISVQAKRFCGNTDKKFTASQGEKTSGAK